MCVQDVMDKYHLDAEVEVKTAELDAEVEVKTAEVDAEVEVSFVDYKCITRIAHILAVVSSRHEYVLLLYLY